MLPSRSRRYAQRSLRSRLIRAGAASLFALTPAVVIMGGGSAHVAAVGASKVDTDLDKVPNQVDPDIDNDGVLNGADPDVDGDGISNANDDDVDGDGLLNGAKTEKDIDGDGVLDVADSDVDGDGIDDHGGGTGGGGTGGVG